MNGAHQEATQAPPLEVVLLEDDPADSELFQHQLISAWPVGVNVVVFGTLAELEAGVGSLDPAVMFCDLTLPDGEGLEVIDRVTKSSTAPVIILTGSVDPAFATLALELGVQDYLQKGEFGPEELARSLRYSMARSIAESETRESANELLQINRELDQFAGVVAHDLRAPIRTARLFANRLAVTALAGDDPTPLADALDSSLGRMELLIDRLLRMASARDHVINLKTERLADVVDDVREDLSVDLQKVKASLSCDCDEEITADPQLIRELLSNLVANCIQYRSPDRDLEVNVGCRRSDWAIEFTVTDNGIGVEPRHRERIFGLFERLDPNGPASSVGFGLAFCQQIVELHHGCITIDESPTSLGLRVRVSLPAQQQSC